MSVVIPAHNEQSLVGPNVRRIVEGDPDGAIEIVVVANGCTDATARVAREISPRVKAVEIAQASKTAALNAGDQVATAFPRAYVDADVVIEAGTLLALGSALDEPDGPLVAAPLLVVDTSGASWWARQFFRVWELTSYRLTGHIGSGVYALSAEGRSRFGRFPDVIADDRFVQQQFQLNERLTLEDRTFTVAAPRTLRAQMRRETRIAVGNRDLPNSLLRVPVESAVSRVSGLLLRTAPRPRLWLAFSVYLGARAAVKLRVSLVARGAAIPWIRGR